MGEFAVAGGFFSADSGDPTNPDYGDAGEAVGIADKYSAFLSSHTARYATVRHLRLVTRFGETWEFNVLTGENGTSAIWGAMRLDSNQIHVNANDFTIRTMNLSDPDHFLASPGIEEIAQRYSMDTRGVR